MAKSKKRKQEELTDEFIQQYRDNYWMGLGDTSQIQTVNPFFTRTSEEKENPHVHLLDLMRRPEYFGYTSQVLFGKTLYPFQVAILKELWVRPFPMLIATRGGGKSFMLAVYCMLRALFTQGSKIVIVGSAFRQAKVVFDYCQDIWEHAGVYRSVVGNDRKNGPKRDIDRCTLRVGDSLIVALPLGDGTKIRGQRANIIISDEFGSISKPIFETVIRGFAAVSLSPIEKAQHEAKKEAMRELGLWTEAHDILDEESLLSNQTIVSGTAFYSWNHFYDYWRQYKALIESRGDENKVREIFGGEIPNKFSHKDYSIIRIPFTSLPTGFMDEKSIANARATIHSGTFNMEYGACSGPDTQIITINGIKTIKGIELGDMVLTHKGRFRPVTKKTYREADGPVMQWSTYGGNGSTITTANHPFWDGSRWEPLGGLTGVTNFVHLQELSGKQFLDVRERVSNWMEAEGGLIYPRHSQSRFTREELNDIRNSNLNQSELARKYGVGQPTIQNIVKQRKKPKNSVPAELPLNFDLGIIIGYYAAEGSCGADGRAVGFALDGHKNIKLEFFISQLISACERTFGFTPKKYEKAQNTVDVVINQRLVVDLIKSICPGVSHTKIVDANVLFSNEEFLKGFIIGYWNGDGHWCSDRDAVKATCVNINLLCQLKLALSYFGIASALRKNSYTGTTIFRGKEYKTRQAFTLEMMGNNGRNFKRMFYGEDGVDNHSSQMFWSEGSISKHTFKTKELIDYSGYVYNLEVEEDHSYSLLDATVHNCFSSDSNGFFKRSLIENCVVNGSLGGSIEQPSCGEVKFQAVLKGHPKRKYVIAADPASEVDNFSITVLEVWPDHRRIVYCWTTNRSRYKAKFKRNLTDENDFYTYSARKIRDLMEVFPTVRVGIDAQGGGLPIIEALQDKNRLKPGERPLLPVVDPDNPADTDGISGDHILEIIQFANSEWVSTSNHGMRKDFEDKKLIFPEFNPIILALALEEDKESGRVAIDTDGRIDKLYDTLDDCVSEIEEMKDELATIVHTQTGISGRDRWDTPETKTEGGKKGRLRKDRYSSLLIANAIARNLSLNEEPGYVARGGFAQNIGRDNPSRKAFGPLYVGPAWYTDAINTIGAQAYGANASRRR